MKTMKNNNNIISLFLFHILFIQVFSNYVILPFNIKKLNSSFLFSSTNYYTLLYLGQPQKTIEMYLLLNQYNFYLGKGLCRLNSISDYIPYESETYKNYSDNDYYVGNIKNVTNSTDNFIFFINDLDLKKNVTVKDIQFYYGVNRFENLTVNNEKICGVIGFNIYYSDPKCKENYFIKILKQKNIVSSYAFSFIFYNNHTKNTIFSKNNKNDNFLIIGMNETEITKLFNTNDFRSIKVIKAYYWLILVDEIFLSYDNSTNEITNKTLINTNTKVNFDNEFDFINIQKKDFIFIRDYFFEDYIKKNICMLNEDSSKIYYISCDINFKEEMNKFPNINFMLRDINYIFTLTYEDLFIEFNQKIYFMIVNELFNTYDWTFGNIFLKKFPLIFDYDKKSITFININTNINNGKDLKFEINYWMFLIGGTCIIVGICFGVIIGKVIWDKNRKKHANELIDDYEYNTKDGNNEQKLYESNNEINN